MAYNEPTGSSQIFDTQFDSTTGFTDYYNSVQIRTDGTAPTSPSNCGYVYLSAGATQGGCELHKFTSTYSDMYARMSFRLNSGFQGRTAADKLFFLRGPDSNGFFGLLGGQNKGGGPFFFYFGHNSGNVDNSHTMSADLGLIGFPNVGPATITPGVWAIIEIYIKVSSTLTSRDGIVRWWVNGILAGNYTNVNYGPGGLNDWVWTQTWDGSGDLGTSNTVLWEQWLDHLYLSTGGTVTPSPSVPTISSFTPTSGPVGTPVTIVGTNFDPSPAGNAVTINNVACAVLASVPTQINTAVPNTATTGQVKVVTSAGTALSSTNFTVTTPDPGGGSGGGTGGGAGTTTGTFTTDFSGTQGPRWYYLNGDGTQMTYSSGSQLWNGAQLYQGIWSGGFHPGSSSAAVLKYVVPGTGSVAITGQAQDLDTGGGAGVVFTIKKNGSTTLFTRIIANGDSSGGEYSITNSVTDGDYFTFEVAAGVDNTYDSTRLNPVVVYTPQSQEEEVITLTLTSLSLTQDTTGSITLTITPTRATDSIITLSSSGASALVPETCTILANTGSTTIQVLAGTPGSATVTATLGTSTTTSTIISVATPDPEDPVPVTPTLSAYTDFLLTYRWF
jgi:hypothetical protein